MNKYAVMRTLHIHIPDEVDLRDHDLTMIIAAKLYEDAKLSSGQAAKMVGVSKRTFIELLGKYNVSVFSNNIADLHSDITNV